jgi:hypothetical protein
MFFVVESKKRRTMEIECVCLFRCARKWRMTLNEKLFTSNLLLLIYQGWVAAFYFCFQQHTIMFVQEKARGENQEKNIIFLTKNKVISLRWGLNKKTGFGLYLFESFFSKYIWYRCELNLILFDQHLTSNFGRK